VAAMVKCGQCKHWSPLPDGLIGVCQQAGTASDSSAEFRVTRQDALFVTKPAFWCKFGIAPEPGEEAK